MTAPGNAYAAGTELAGKVALVTGAARNIGRATALSLAAGGAAVAINTRASIADAEKVAKEIRDGGGKAEVFVADIADGKQVKAMGEAILAKFGRIDILVLNASVRSEKPFTQLTYDEWRVPLGITLDGAFFCTQACLPSMLANGGGTMPMLWQRYLRQEGTLKNKQEIVPNGVLHEVKRFYYDTAQANHAGALRALLSLVEVSQLMFGTDYPYRPGSEVVEGLGSYGFSAAELRAIDRDNALRLLPDLKA